MQNKNRFETMEINSRVLTAVHTISLRSKWKFDAGVSRRSFKIDYIVRCELSCFFRCYILYLIWASKNKKKTMKTTTTTAMTVIEYSRCRYSPLYVSLTPHFGYNDKSFKNSLRKENKHLQRPTKAR